MFVKCFSKIILISKVFFKRETLESRFFEKGRKVVAFIPTVLCEYALRTISRSCNSDCSWKQWIWMLLFGLGFHVRVTTKRATFLLLFKQEATVVQKGKRNLSFTFLSCYCIRNYQAQCKSTVDKNEPLCACMLPEEFLELFPLPPLHTLPFYLLCWFLHSKKYFLCFVSKKHNGVSFLW